MSQQIEHIIITDHQGREIGSVGFLGNEVAVITAFYEDSDGNLDGSVGFLETIWDWFGPVSTENRAVTTVAQFARLDERVYGRDAGFDQVARQLFYNFARGLLIDGAYEVYLSGAVADLVAQFTHRIPTQIVRGFIVRKGLEDKVKEIFDAAIGR